MNVHYAITIREGGYGVLLTYCGNEGGIKRVLAESEQQTCLSDPAVSDEKQLEEIIVRFCHLKKLHTQRFRYIYILGLQEPPFLKTLSLWRTGSKPVPKTMTSAFAVHCGTCRFQISTLHRAHL